MELQKPFSSLEKKDLYLAIGELEKAFDQVPRDVV